MKCISWPPRQIDFHTEIYYNLNNKNILELQVYNVMQYNFPEIAKRFDLAKTERTSCYG